MINGTPSNGPSVVKSRTIAWICIAANFLATASLLWVASYERRENVVSFGYEGLTAVMVQLAIGVAFLFSRKSGVQVLMFVTEVVIFAISLGYANQTL